MINNFKSRLHETKPSLDFNEASMIDWMMLDFLNSSWLSPRVYWNYLLMCLETRCQRSFFKRNCSYFYYFMSTFWLEWRKWFKEGQFIRRALDFFSQKSWDLFFNHNRKIVTHFFVDCFFKVLTSLAQKRFNGCLLEQNKFCGR